MTKIPGDIVVYGFGSQPGRFAAGGSTASRLIRVIKASIDRVDIRGLQVGLALDQLAATTTAGYFTQLGIFRVNQSIDPADCPAISSGAIGEVPVYPPGIELLWEQIYSAEFINRVGAPSLVFARGQETQSSWRWDPEEMSADIGHFLFVSASQPQIADGGAGAGLPPARIFLSVTGIDYQSPVSPGISTAASMPRY